MTQRREAPARTLGLLTVAAAAWAAGPALAQAPRVGEELQLGFGHSRDLARRAAERLLPWARRTRSHEELGDALEGRDGRHVPKVPRRRSGDALVYSLAPEG